MINSFPEYSGNKPKSTRQLDQWHALSVVEAALEPHLPIVDPHHHLYGKAGDADYYELDDLRRDLDQGHRVIGTVYVEAYGSGWRSDGPEALRPVGEVDMIMGITKAPLQTRSGPCHMGAGIVCYAA